MVLWRQAVSDEGMGATVANRYTVNTSNRAFVQCCFTSTGTIQSIKPDPNWANILPKVRRTIIRFLTQLLVRPTWFAQFDELYFVLAYNEMQASARTCGRSATDSMIQNVGQSQVMWIYFYHPSRSNSTNYYIILGPRDKTAPPTSQQIGQFPPKRVNYRHRHPFLFLFLPHLQESSLCSQPVRGNVRRTGRIFPEHAERSFLDPEYSFVAVRRISRTRFATKKFVHLRTNYVGLRSTNISNYVREANVRPIE